jgi:hypothetical protein
MQSHTLGGSRTLVAIDGDAAVPTTFRRGARVVRTPLDLIQALEQMPQLVVLGGSFARDRSFAGLVRELAPTCELVMLSSEDRPVMAQLCYA